MKKVRLLQRWLGKPNAKIGDIIEVSDEVAEDLFTRGGKRGPIAEKIEAGISDNKRENISEPNKPLSQMNNSELTARAAKLGIDISGAKNKRQRIALIKQGMVKGMVKRMMKGVAR